MNPTVCPTYRYDIFIAGDIDQAKQICREHCFEAGLCVTVEPVSYIYTGGEEIGVRVGLINYPRFPAESDDISDKATVLGLKLLIGLHQHSFSIVGPENTAWYSRRSVAKPGDAA